MQSGRQLSRGGSCGWVGRRPRGSQVQPAAGCGVSEQGLQNMLVNPADRPTDQPTNQSTNPAFFLTIGSVEGIAFRHLWKDCKLLN